MQVGIIIREDVTFPEILMLHVHGSDSLGKLRFAIKYLHIISRMRYTSY